MFEKVHHWLNRRRLAQQGPTATSVRSPDNFTKSGEALLEMAIDQYWVSNFEVTKDFRVQFVADVAGDIRQEGLEILSCGNSLAKNRESLLAAVTSMSSLDILVAHKESDPDHHLFLQPTISGELKPLVFDLWQVDNRLRELIEPEVKMERRDWDSVWNPILFKYRICWAKANIHNALRIATGDGHPSSPEDWFQTLHICLAIEAEDDARKKLNLPRLLDGDPQRSGLMALCAGSICNRVAEGHVRPDTLWRQMLSDSEIGRATLSKIVL